MNPLALRTAGLAAILFLCGAALFGAYQHGVTVTDARWGKKQADERELGAKVLAAATTANRTEEQRRQAASNQVGSDAREQIKAAGVDAHGADVAGERLHVEAAKLAASTSCTPGNSGAAERGQAAARAAMVLSDLFQRADQRAGELAKALDQSRVAGLACERAYDSLFSANL